MTTCLARPHLPTYAERATAAAPILARSIEEQIRQCITGTGVRSNQYAIEFMVNYSHPEMFRVSVNSEIKLSCINGHPMGVHPDDLSQIKVTACKAKKNPGEGAVENGVQEAINVVESFYVEAWETLASRKAGMAKVTLFFSGYRASGGRITYDFPL